MRSENVAKIALNAAKLAEFEAVSRKSWPPSTIMLTDFKDFVHAHRGL